MDMLDARNAQQVVEYAAVSREETLQALRSNGEAAAAAVRDLTDEELERSAPMAYPRWATLEHLRPYRAHPDRSPD